RPLPRAAVHVVDAERAPAGDAKPARREPPRLSHGAFGGAICLAVLVRRVARPLASALPFELRAEPLLLRRAEPGRLVAGHARLRNPARFVRVSELVDVEPGELDRFAGQLFVGESRRPVARRAREKGPGRDPDHAFAGRRVLA